MEGSMTRLETFCNLGYRRDPFFGAQYRTGDMVRVERILAMAVESRAMISIVGERGIGKTKAVKAALDKMKVKRVNVEKLDKETCTIGDIRTAMITDLAPENTQIKRGGEVSSRQLRRIVGEAATAANARPIVVVIEEAQRLHANTLRSLKSLREMEWLGQSELFTVLLLAQSDPMNRPGVSEVQLRSDIVRMKGLSADEAADYVTVTLGNRFEEPALAALSDLPQARNYLELQELCVKLLNRALACGREQVTSDDVQAVSGEQGTEPLPKSAPRKQATAPAASGAGALKSVLSRRSGQTEEGKEAAAC
ncbi:MAG TPA: ATP-binding protein [Desulfuromonadaceae bacterium]